jgi:hypothetical protein
MAALVSDATPGSESALAAARVIETTVDLARAEAGLVLAHARSALVSTASLVVATMLAASSAQVALLLVALSPVLFADAPRSVVLATLLPSVCLSLIGGWLAFSAWQKLKRGSTTAAPRGQ